MLSFLTHLWSQSALTLALDFEEFFRRAISILLFVFFFAGPLLKRGQKQGTPKPTPRRVARSPKRSELEQRGQDLWKQLIEGIDPEAAEVARERTPPIPKPAPPRLAPAPQPTSRAAVFEPPAAQLSDFAFSEIDEEGLERSAQPAGEYEALVATGVKDAPRVAREPVFDWTSNPEALRSAVVMSELLNRPLALRGSLIDQERW